MPADLGSYRVVMVYIHRSISPASEEAFIRYAQDGGKLFLLHHSISSGKRENKQWFPFLDISLPNKPYAEGGYKYFDPADFDDAVATRDFQARGFRVEYDLAHRR